MNEWLLSVVKKKCTHALPESPLHLFQQKRRVLYEWEKEKKFNFVPSFLSLTNYYYLILSVKCVCSFFPSRARWTTATACKLEAMFNHVLKLENVNIYIYIYIQHTSPQLGILINISWERFLSYTQYSHCCYCFKKRSALNFDLNSKEKKKEEEQTKPAAIKIYVRRIE